MAGILYRYAVRHNLKVRHVCVPFWCDQHDLPCTRVSGKAPKLCRAIPSTEDGPGFAEYGYYIVVAKYLLLSSDQVVGSKVVHGSMTGLLPLTRHDGFVSTSAFLAGPPATYIRLIVSSPPVYCLLDLLRRIVFPSTRRFVFEHPCRAATPTGTWRPLVRS